MQISNSLFEELRSDELTGVMPLLTVGGEDTVSKKRPPYLVEFLSFTYKEICVSKPLKGISCARDINEIHNICSRMKRLS